MLRLLLVEDEDNLRCAMRDVIDWQAMGVDALALAANGEEALAKLDAFGPHIVLSDINMPGISGLEMAQRMLSRRPDLRLIFFSAYSEIGYLQQALRMGSVDYLLKPLRSEELADAIARAAGSLVHLKRQRAGSQLLRDYGEQLLPPLLRDLLLAEKPQEALAEQLLSLDIQRSMAAAALLFLTGLSKPEEATVLACIERVSQLAPERGMLLPLHEALWAYVEIMPAQPPEGWPQDVARQLTLHLQLSGQLSAQVQPMPPVPTLGALYGLGSQCLLQLGDAQRSGRARDAQRAGRLCREIQAYIAGHYAERDLSASTIARHLHYTSAYICTIFKHEQQMTIHDFINLYRTTQAKALLSGTDDSIAAIAQATGYENDNYFSRVFRKLEGMSPSDFRKGHRP